MRFTYIAFAVTGLLHTIALAGFIYFSHPWFSDDSAGYLNLATSLVEGRGFGKMCDFGFLVEPSRLPGYPAFIASISLLFGDGSLNIVIVQAVLVLISVFLVYRIATGIFGRSTGNCFLGLSAIYPFIANAASFISPEVVCLFLITVAVYFLRVGTNLSLVGSAFCFASAAYMRPNLILLGPAIAFVCSIFHTKGRFRFLIIPLVIAGLFVPWMIRNYRDFGTLTPTAAVSGLGVSVFVASWESRISTPALMAFGRGVVNDEANESGLVYQTNLISEKVRECCPGEDAKIILSVASCESVAKQNTVDREMMRLGIANIKEQPVQYLMNVTSNVFRMWFTYFGLNRFPWPVRLALIVNGVGALVLGITGLSLALGRSHQLGFDPALLASIVAVLYVPATQAWLNTQARYTIPVRMFMLMFGAYAIVRIIAFFKPTAEPAA